MPNVVLVGAFGRGNPGAEALCRAFLTHLCTDHEVVVASANPSRTEAEHGVPSIASDVRSIVTAARVADVVVLGGGTVFKASRRSARGRSVSSLRDLTALVAGARATGTKVAMIDVGADELTGRAARRMAGWIVGRIDLLVLREEESAAALADAGVATPFWVGADATWLLPAPPPVIGVRPSAITVALNHLAVDDRLLRVLADVVRPLCADHDVRLQPWQVDALSGDVALAERALLALDGNARIVAPPADLVSAVEDFANQSLVIATRYHALVAAARAGTRTLAIDFEPKMAGLSRRLGLLAVPVNASAEVIAAAVDQALIAPPPAPSSVRGEVVAAHQSFGLLDLLLRDGALEDPGTFEPLPLSTGTVSW